MPEMTTQLPDPQHQSTFITRLPREVRDRIYLELWRSCGLRQHIVWHRNKDGKAKSHFCRRRCTTPFSVQDELQENIDATRIQLGIPLGDSFSNKAYALELFSAWKNHFACGQRIAKVYGEDADPGIRTCSSLGPCWSSHKLSSGKLSSCSPYMSMLLSCKVLSSECIESIYESTNFIFTDIFALNYLRWILSSLRMKRLSRSDPNYKDHEVKFYHSWCHDEKSAKVKSIYLASRDDIDKSYRGQRFFKYLNGGSYKRLYHGTSRACHIGESGNDLKLCYDDDCGTCSILRQSFKLKYADDEGMFGPGIYSTPNSSKADVYVKNHYVSSNLHAMLICYVVASKPQHKLLADHDITRSSRGFNCVEGVTIDNGGSLQCPEFVVYREDAIIPVGLIMYTRKGWEPL